MRWLATFVIAALLALVALLPQIPFARRGHERAARAHVPALASFIGEPLPDLVLEDLEGRPVRPGDLRGHALLLVFERSVDW